MEIHVLKRQGRGIREIARLVGRSRNTVRAVLRGGHDGQYGPRTPRASKLDPYKSYLRERMQTAGSIALPATVLLREIRERGYDGGYTQLTDYLRTIKPPAPPEPVIRFETEPGKQLQIDFVVFRRGASPLRAFTAELGYSRYPYVEFTDNERAETLIACLERALHWFGGAPQHVLCDNPKTIVIERNAYGDGRHRFNDKLYDLAKHYGFSHSPLRAVSCADEGETRTLPPLLARIVLQSTSSREIGTRRRCPRESGGVSLATRRRRSTHPCHAQRTPDRTVPKGARAPPGARAAVWRPSTVAV